jgi:misacylated tRNA(Ala) deacylase
VEKLNQNAVDLKRKEAKLLKEIAKFEGDRVKLILQTGGKALVYRADEGLEYLNLIAYEIKDSIKESGVCVLASGEWKKGGQVLIVGEDKSVEEMAKKVKEVLKAIKGGGVRGKWQGKVVQWEKGELEALRKIVEG